MTLSLSLSPLWDPLHFLRAFAYRAFAYSQVTNWLLRFNAKPRGLWNASSRWPFLNKYLSPETLLHCFLSDMIVLISAKLLVATALRICACVLGKDLMWSPLATISMATSLTAGCRAFHWFGLLVKNFWAMADRRWHDDFVSYGTYNYTVSNLFLQVKNIRKRSLYFSTCG